MQIKEFITKYREYCDRKYGTKNGTASSYANALKYLFDYLDFDDINEAAILTVKSIEPDIRDKYCAFYNNILHDFSTKGRSSYIEKGFVKAAIPTLYEFLNENVLPLNDNQDNILLDAIHDNKIIAQFNPNTLRHVFPIVQNYEHSYDIRRVNGTTKDAAKKICNGRKAEKYFLSFLKDYLGLKQGIDFIDVSKNKEYGYDIRLFDRGIEVKNIKNGGFYLTDNEIARIGKSETHLILVDIDNGIWLLKNNSPWLKQMIANIKEIRKYCYENYNLLDLTDIRINVDEIAKNETIEISKLTKEQFKDLLIL